MGSKQIFEQVTYPSFSFDSKFERDAIEQFRQTYLNDEKLNLHRRYEINRIPKEIVKHVITMIKDLMKKVEEGSELNPAEFRLSLETWDELEEAYELSRMLKAKPELPNAAECRKELLESTGKYLGRRIAQRIIDSYKEEGKPIAIRYKSFIKRYLGEEIVDQLSFES